MPISRGPPESLFRLAASFVLAPTIAAGAAAAQQRPCDPAALGPSRDLYCIELVAAPGIAGASGMVELGHVPGPFTVAVTPDGRPRYRLSLSVSGLPAPQSLGDFRTYLAWVAPPAMHPVRRLGEVADGRTELGDVDLEKFVILLTAERDAQMREPAGRVVLRGQSPSTRLFPPDLLEFSIGTMGVERSGRHHGHRAASEDSAGPRWTTVPMSPGLTMLPAEMALRPDAQPYLPAGDAAAARPRELKIMTANGAKILGVDQQIGTVERGKVADLVVLEGNLTTDPGVIRKPTVVFKDGVGYDSAKLIASIEGRVGID
jgi:amidohydrolase family protein